MTKPAVPTAMSVGTTNTSPPKPPRTTSNPNTTAASWARNVDEIPAETPATTSAWTNTTGQPSRTAADEREMATDHGRWRVRPEGKAEANAQAAPEIATRRVVPVQAPVALEDAIDDVRAGHRRLRVG